MGEDNRRESYFPKREEVIVSKPAINLDEKSDVSKPIINMGKTELSVSKPIIAESENLIVSKPVFEENKNISKGKEVKVYNIVNGKLFLKDIKTGAEYRLRITEKNKDTKIGDIIILI
jgi:hypothetical protein